MTPEPHWPDRLLETARQVNGERGRTMTETKFTPGPWEARYSSVIDVEKDEIIAVMTCGSVYRKNELEDYDTARLIAAAPDLLESLTNLVGLAKLGAAHLDKYHAALSDAEAAIARARGES